jgi:hypothetical protein
VACLQLQKPREVFCRIGTAFDGEEIYDLYQQTRVAVAGAADGFDEFAEPGQEAFVADAQERSTGYVAHARRFDDDGTRSPRRETPVPFEHFARHETVFRRAPRNHRRNPRPLFKLERANLDRLKEESTRRRLARRPARVGDVVPDDFRWVPHNF